MAPNNLTLDDLVKRSMDLPSLPATAYAVIRETEMPSASAETIAKYLAQDQALTARILRLANSAYYGLPGQVLDLSEAVVVLGTRCIRSICTVASTYPWLVNPVNKLGTGPKEIWSHSFAVGLGAKIVAERTKQAAPERAFTAGLLHNLGSVALAVCLESKMRHLVDEARRRLLPIEQVEKSILGYDHCELGGQIGDAWNLPAQLVEVMRYHHNPEACYPKSKLVDCVHVADYLTMSMGIGLGGDGLRYDFKQAAMTRLGLEVSDLEFLGKNFVALYEQQDKFFDAAA